MKTKFTFKIPYGVRILGACTTVALFGGSFTAAAAESPPEFMTYQGYLVDGDGDALGLGGTENYDVVFSIYMESANGSPLWSEQQTVTVADGYFSVLLGEGGGGDISPVFSGADASERYIQIGVKGLNPSNLEEVLPILPRLKLVASPYAFLATRVVASAIGSDEIADSAVGNADLATDAVNSLKIENNSIFAIDLGLDSVGSSEIAASAVGSSEIANYSITAVDIAQNAVGAYQIGSSAVGTSEVADNSLTANDLAASSVGSSEIANYSITSSDIGSGAVNSYGIANGSITAADLSKSSLGSQKLTYSLAGSIAANYYWNTISDSVVREYLADEDGGRIKIIVTRQSDNYVWIFVSNVYINSSTGKGYSRGDGSGSADRAFNLKTGAKYEIVNPNYSLFFVRNYAGVGTQEGAAFTDLSLSYMSAPGYDVTFILYDD